MESIFVTSVGRVMVGIQNGREVFRICPTLLQEEIIELDKQKLSAILLNSILIGEDLQEEWSRVYTGFLWETTVPMKESVSNYMLQCLDLDYDSFTDSAGEINCTKLAEEAANHLEHDEWLDDDTHWVWDLAIEAADVYQQAS